MINRFFRVDTDSHLTCQLCVWSIDTWEKRKSIPIQLPAGKTYTSDTRVQFHSDQIRLLVSHETQLALYDASKMERIRQVETTPLTSGINKDNAQLQ